MTTLIGETFTNSQIQWKRISNDVNGNPRYVCHFLNLLKDKEKTQADWIDPTMKMSVRYTIAKCRANEIGGRKYNTKHYRGGIVFQSYNIQDTERAIFDLLAKE